MVSTKKKHHINCYVAHSASLIWKQRNESPLNYKYNLGHQQHFDWQKTFAVA